MQFLNVCYFVVLSFCLEPHEKKKTRRLISVFYLPSTLNFLNLPLQIASKMLLPKLIQQQRTKPNQSEETKIDYTVTYKSMILRIIHNLSK